MFKIFSTLAVCVAMLPAGCSKGNSGNAEITVSEIKLNKTELSLTVGNEETLMAEILPENASDKTVEWISSAPDIVSVDHAGKIVALAVGPATITAGAGGKSAACEVTVSDIFGGVTVYAGGYEYNSGVEKYIGKIWKNGEVIFSTDPSYYCEIRSIFVSDGDVYAGGFSYESYSGKKIARIWKNGEQIFSTDEGSDAEIHSICVLSGNVYAGGFELNAETGRKTAKVWKDGTPTDYLPKNNFTSFIYSICVADNGDVYAGGDEGRAAAIWKNGESIHVGEYPQNINSIFLSGSDIYAGGYQYDYTRDIPTVWKNGEIEYTIAGTENAKIKSIYVLDGDIYTCGHEQTGFDYIAKIWKNEEVIFTSAKEGSIYAILIYDGDIYAGGNEVAADGWTRIAEVWRNGRLIFSTDGTENAYITSIVVQ